MPLLAVYFVAASPGYRGVGTPAAIGQVESHAVCRAALAAPCLMGQGMDVAGASGLCRSHVFSFAALGCLVVEVLSPAPGGRLICVTRRALPRLQRFAAPLLTPFTHFGDWRRFCPRRALLTTACGYCSVSMGEGDVNAALSRHELSDP
jgi:hypothetical protein